MKIIRWWGVIAFLILMLVIAAVWYLFAPGLIQNSIEEIGSEALGAKVEVGSVELSLFPVAVEINQLVATDPEQPMQNIFESDNVKFAVDASALLWKKVIIEELVLSGVKTATKRTTSGALEGGRQSTQAVEQIIDSVVPDLENMDVNQLVEKADLITLKRIETLKQNQNKLKAEWQTDLDKQAFGKRTEALKVEYDRLAKRAKKNKLNLLKDRKEWKALKKAIDVERKQIASLKTKLKQDKNLLSKQLKSVKAGPTDDLDAVMGKLGVSNGVDGLVDKYLGPQYTPWVKKAIEMAKGFKPKKSSQQEEKATLQIGQRVVFKDQHVFPELLIKKIKLDGSNEGVEIGGKGFDLGYFPWLTGKPAKLDIDFAGRGNAKLNVISDWASSEKMLTKVSSNVSNWKLDSTQFMQTEAGAWVLNSGSLTAKLEGKLTLEKIDLNASFSISSPKLSAPDNVSGWQKSLAASINNESSISIKLTAKGSLTDPKIKLDSSLDQLFKKAIGDKVKQKAEKLKGKVKQSIADKIGDISDLEKFNGNFDQWQSQMGDKDKLLQGLLGKLKIK